MTDLNNGGVTVEPAGTLLLPLCPSNSVTKATKTVDGLAFPPSAFAYVPDTTKPSTWKLRLHDTPADAIAGKPSVQLTAAAVLALSPVGFRGNRVQLPASSVAGVKAKVASAWLKARTGRGITRDDLPAILKAAPVPSVSQQPTPLKAVELTLDMIGQAAFLRLSKSLPAFASTVAALARDLVVVPALKVDIPATTETLISDLTAVQAQVKDEGTLKRIGAVLRPYAVPHNANPGEETDTVKIDVRILKVDAAPTTTQDKVVEERTVLGVVLEPETVDSQKDVYSAEEIRKTAFRFMERYQQFGLMHKTIVPSVLPLESYLAPVDFEVNGQKIKKGTWLLRLRVLDDGIWKDVKSGKLTGLSIGGSAVRTPDVVPAAA